MEKKQIFMFGAAGAFFMAFLMAIMKVFTVRISAFGQSAKETFGMPWFPLVLVILLNLGAIALTILPELNLIPKKPFYKWIVLGAAGAALLIFLITWIAAGAQAMKALDMEGVTAKQLREYGIKFSVGLSFGGILLLLFEIGAGVLSFLKIKADKE